MKWTGEAKLKAVVDTSGLSESEVGAYVRREGLYSNQVSEWRTEIIEHLGTKASFKKDERDEKIKVLEREILRKDKALAEGEGGSHLPFPEVVQQFYVVRREDRAG